MYIDNPKIDDKNLLVVMNKIVKCVDKQKKNGENI